MAKAMKTIKESLNYPPQYAEYFAANQALFNRVVAFYFEVLQAHEGVLDLTTKEALTALETLTHATEKNPSPILPLTEIAEGIPSDVPTCCHQRSSGISPLLLFLSQEMENAQREGPNQTRPKGREEEGVQGAPTCPSQAMEQVRSLVRGNVEGAYRLIHPAQSVDGHLLELGQGAHALTCTARWI